MLSLLRALMRARAARPLLLWMLKVLGYVVFQPPQPRMLVLIVGLGVALAVTVGRLRSSGRKTIQRGERAWRLAERLTRAVEDRIRGKEPTVSTHPIGGYGQDSAAAYDPGALLSTVVAVLAAEGLLTNAAPALPAIVSLLADMGITSHRGAPAATAWGLVEAVQPADAARRYRVMSPALLASVIRVVLTHDQVIPHTITVDTAKNLITNSAEVLAALAVEPTENSGLDQWPIIAKIIDAAPLPAPAQQWGR